MVNRITAKFFVIVEKCMKTLSKTFEIGIGLLVFSTVISENEKKKHYEHGLETVFIVFLYLGDIDNEIQS